MAGSLIWKRGLLLVGLALLFALPTTAQNQFDAEKDIPINASVEPASVQPGGQGILKIVFALPPNVHITSLDNGFFFVTPDSDGVIEWSLASYPAGETVDGETVYRGNVEVTLPFSLPATAATLTSLKITGAVGYQVCTEVDPVFCAPPVERRFETSLVVANGAAAESVEGSADMALTVEARAKRALERGSLEALLWIFLGGVLLSFTPCVYPVIPITIAYIGSHSGGSRLKGFSLSLVFVLGLGLVYSTLGVVAAATGGVFGLSTQNPWVIGFVTVVFLIMGNGMLGAFDLQLPSSVQSAMMSRRSSGYLGALFVGGTTGLVAAPCVGPVLVALLSWVATSGKIIPGFLYLFVFAMGLGSLFVLIGTFAGALAALPKAGGWMERVKHFFGVVMIAVAYYMARPLIPMEWFLLLVGFGLLALSAFFGGFHKLEDDAEFFPRWIKAITTFMMVGGVFYTLLGLARLNGVIGDGAKNQGAVVVAAPESKGSEAAGINWIQNDEAAALALAKESGKPVMIDFWAEWCVACEELDHKTFSDPVVAKYIQAHFVPLKIDGTKVNGPVKQIWARYGVKGLPTVLFLRPDGSEIERFEAYRTVEQTMPVLKKVAE